MREFSCLVQVVTSIFNQFNQLFIHRLSKSMVLCTLSSWHPSKNLFFSFLNVVCLLRRVMWFMMVFLLILVVDDFDLNSACTRVFFTPRRKKVSEKGKCLVVVFSGPFHIYLGPILFRKVWRHFVMIKSIPVVKISNASPDTIAKGIMRWVQKMTIVLK